MSHHTFATVWMQLKARTDIDNILCETIGHYNLESSIPVSSDETLRDSLRLVVFFKVVFDLQRTYSQCSNSSAESAYLLQPKQLFLAIIHLIHLKARVYRRPRDTSVQFTTHRCFLAQTLVSGLRALWLRKYDLSKDQISFLQRELNEAWKGEELTGLEKFIHQIVRRTILEGLGDLNSDLSRPACGQAQLQSYSTGLVSFLDVFQAWW